MFFKKKNKPLEIKIKYFDEDCKIEKISKGDWIDLKAAEDVTMKKGEFKLIKLGVGMILPDGYEALLAPRSSTYKKWHVIQTNSVGVIDNSYSGENLETGERDEWMFPALADKATAISKGDRICQFRIIEKMNVELVETDRLNDKVRGGFGSTGAK